MTGNSNATANPPAVRRMAFPLLGITSLIAGAILPIWAVIGTIAGGPEAGGWVPLILLFFFPFNLLALALFIVAVVCGIYAVRRTGVDRVLGVIGLALAGMQLLAAVLMTLVFIGW